MVGGVSKRQQLRNERALQDLIRSVPGNDRCADCSAMNPGWASWNLGIFLCMRCAALHRKLGTHISKVKSLSMDSWSSEQVDNMKSHGNTIMNKIYNPKNVKPPIPVDIDETDSCMERFIRQKYQYRSLEDGKPKPPNRHDSGYDRSPEDSPPPLPPKTGKFFGFGLRSASSTSNLQRPSTSRTAPISPRSERQGSRSPPLPVRKGSQGFGASFGDMDSTFEAKLAALKDMGFPDERRNATMLRGLSGNLEKTIESLVRLGEGSHPGSRARTPVPPTRTAPSENVPPTTTQASTNPFDQLDSKPQTQVNGKSYNPFDMPTTQPAQPAQPMFAQPLEASFQQLQVSQPLFPHSTGGYPSQQASVPQPLYQQSMTPPVAQSTFSQASFVSSPQSFDGSHNPFFQTAHQPQVGAVNPALNQNLGLAQSNPFFSRLSPQHTSLQTQFQAQPTGQVPSISVPRTPQHAHTMPPLSPNSPFGQQQSPFQQQQPAQSPYNPFQSSMAPTAPQHMGYQNPHQQQTQSQLQPGFQSPPQFLTPQPTGRVDKNSILALYNFSPAPPTIPEQQQQQQQAPGLSPVPTLTPSMGSTPQTQPSSNFATPQHGATMPTPSSAGVMAGGSRNPFMSASPGTRQPDPAASTQQSGLGIGMGMKPPQGHNNPFPRSHTSQQSVDINGLQNGRHSPDAFASLSARYG